MKVEVGGRVELRCHSCSHSVGLNRVPARIIGLFKPSLFGRFPKRAGEFLRRCDHCGWVNVFTFHTKEVDVELKRRIAA